MHLGQAYLTSQNVTDPFNDDDCLLLHVYLENMDWECAERRPPQNKQRVLTWEGAEKDPPQNEQLM